MEMPLKVDAQLPLCQFCFHCVVGFIRFDCALIPSELYWLLLLEPMFLIVCTIKNDLKCTPPKKRELIWTLDVPEHFNLVYPFFKVVVALCMQPIDCALLNMTVIWF